ncbi:unnamed protein product [Linum tenue]|uniref:Uncharacterized protein n=1 Tax=Linum tenue TaxID=586396 RepID=A0AAV0RIB5_9ROSI|nr:unnamed protein product [Linum tenue]
MAQYYTSTTLLPLLFLLFLLCPTEPAAAACDGDDKSSSKGGGGGGTLIKYKVGSMASILAAGAIGVSLPLFLKRSKTTSSETAVAPDDGGHGGAAGGGGGGMLIVKAFAGGVILATGLVHIIPDAFEKLGSDCLPEVPWGKFPFAGFVAMMFAIATLSMESLAMGFYKRQQQLNQKKGDDDVGDENIEAAGGDRKDDDDDDEMIRRRIVSQILEMGVVVHSTIIGMSLGTCKSVKTAKLKMKSRVLMAVFFSITAPIGIGIGMGISNHYKENSSASLIVEGMFTSASAGILIYMALVDLLATDFMGGKMLESDFRVQVGAYASLFLGATSMSLLALVV